MALTSKVYKLNRCQNIGQFEFIGNIRPIMDPYNMGPNPERCDLCDIKFTSSDHANSHYSGRKHKKKTCDVYAYQMSTNAYQQANFCQICKIQVSGPAPMKQHQESARHIKKLQEVLQRSRNGSGDSDDSRSSSSPTGSTYNDFDFRPDSTTMDKPDMENRQDNYPRASSTFDPNIPHKEEARCFHEDGFQPNSTDSVSQQQNAAMAKPLNSTELATKLEALELSKLKEQLVVTCTEMIQKQLETMIPTIVEKIVDKTIESLQEVGRQQQQEALGDGMMIMSTHSPGRDNLISNENSSYVSFQTPASSVCSQLFPTAGNYESTPVSMNGPSMNGHHSFAGSSFQSNSSIESNYHSAKVTMPPPGFSPRLNNLCDERKY